MGQCAGKGNKLEKPGSKGSGAGAAPKRRLKERPSVSYGTPLEALPTKSNFGLTFLTPKHMLGEGGSGETWLMEDNASGALVAVKLIKRPIPKVLHEMILHEILIQGELGEGHMNIVQSTEVVLTSSHLALILEYAAGGTLTKYVSDRWDTVHQRGGLFLEEHEALYFFKQFISAVEYCHKNNVAHRDLKLDNTLLDNSNPPLIKICDFGFAKNFDPESNMYTRIGTPVYMSPEVISSKCGRGYDGRKADVWASGVMLFVMLLGMFPYEHVEHPDPNTSAAQVEVWLQQIKTNWRENSRVQEVVSRLSRPCQDFLDHVFDLNEKRRMSIHDIKAHPWFQTRLEAKYESALSKLLIQQDNIEGKVRQGAFKSRQRDEALKDMVAHAAKIGSVSDPLIRIKLNVLQNSYSFPNLADPSANGQRD